jgi:hypothetical protein
MSEAFDSTTTNLMSRVLEQALDRLKERGVINGDARAASAALSRLILQAAETGERTEEKLIALAVDRFQGAKPGADHTDG